MQGDQELEEGDVTLGYPEDLHVAEGLLAFSSSSRDLEHLDH